MGGTLENVLAIVLALAIPIVLIVGLVYAYVSKNRNAYRLRTASLTPRRWRCCCKRRAIRPRNRKTMPPCARLSALSSWVWVPWWPMRSLTADWCSGSSWACLSVWACSSRSSSSGVSLIAALQAKPLLTMTQLQPITTKTNSRCCPPGRSRQLIKPDNPCVSLSLRGLSGLLVLGI